MTVYAKRSFSEEQCRGWQGKKKQRWKGRLNAAKMDCMIRGNWRNICHGHLEREFLERKGMRYR